MHIVHQCLTEFRWQPNPQFSATQVTNHASIDSYDKMREFAKEKLTNHILDTMVGLSAEFLTRYQKKIQEEKGEDEMCSLVDL